MSLQDFQRALTAMTLDAGLANEVHARGTPALSGYDLTPREERRLLAVVRQPGMALNCTLARANRFAAIHDAFPMTCRLLGPDLRGVLDALWSARSPDNYQLSGEELPFAEAVEARLAAGPCASPYLAEVLAYERACLDLAIRLRGAAQPQALRSEPRWTDFAHDPRPLFAALGRAELPPPDLPLERYRVRVTLIGDELETTTFRVLPDDAQ
jgi:hypothetical protein